MIQYLSPEIAQKVADIGLVAILFVLAIPLAVTALKLWHMR